MTPTAGRPTAHVPTSVVHKQNGRGLVGGRDVTPARKAVGLGFRV